MTVVQRIKKKFILVNQGGNPLVKYKGEDNPFPTEIAMVLLKMKQVAESYLERKI